MLTRPITARIPGVPAPKGSMRCIGRVGPIAHKLVDQLKSTKKWTDRVTEAAGALWPADQCASPGQPIALEATFHFVRPAAHFGTGRNAERLKDSAPAFPVFRGVGDGDKHLRALADALQAAGVLADDSQVVDWHAFKRYADTSGVRFTLTPIATDGLPL